MNEFMDKFCRAPTGDKNVNTSKYVNYYISGNLFSMVDHANTIEISQLKTMTCSDSKFILII